MFRRQNGKLFESTYKIQDFAEVLPGPTFEMLSKNREVKGPESGRILDAAAEDSLPCSLVALQPCVMHADLA